jgi:hypothetical protein
MNSKFIEFLSSKELEEKMMFDALFGSDEEMNDETAREILDSYNISNEELISDLKSKIQGELKENYGKPEKDVESQNLGKILRDISNYQRANDISQIEPKTWVQSILDNTLNTISPNRNQLAYRNRNDENDCENDNKVIDELKSDLDKE